VPDLLTKHDAAELLGGIAYLLWERAISRGRKRGSSTRQMRHWEQAAVD
jgi:hypothetical protein